MSADLNRKLSSWERVIFSLVMKSFVAAALDPARAGNFFASLLPFVGRIAKLGARNTLVQTVLKLTLPGMPDIYQGCELGDLSLVDPDNRRPVDYSLRMQALRELTAELRQDRLGAMRRYAAGWQNGHFKLAAIVTLLAYRREQAALFETGSYQPLIADGPNSDQILGFLRRFEGQLMLTAVGRYPARLAAEGIVAECGIPLPEALHETGWRDLISGAQHQPTSCLRPKDVFALLPAAVLVAE
jgi:(1->4)-alpha-D-glucan 1-alpha-D-glucosylmutase